LEKALRALRLISLVSWLLLVSFIGLNIYLAATGQFWIYISRPFSIRYKNITKFVAYVRIINKGFFDIINLDLKASLLDREGRILCENSTRIEEVRPGADMLLSIVIYLPLEASGAGGPLNMTIIASMIYAYVFPMDIKASFKVEAPAALSSPARVLR